MMNYNNEIYIIAINDITLIYNFLNNYFTYKFKKKLDG